MLVHKELSSPCVSYNRLATIAVPAHQEEGLEVKYFRWVSVLYDP